MKQIEMGLKSKEECSRILIQIYKNIYRKISTQERVLFESFDKYINRSVQVTSNLHRSSEGIHTGRAGNRTNSKKVGARPTDQVSIQPPRLPPRPPQVPRVPKQQVSLPGHQNLQQNPVCFCNKITIKLMTTKYVEPRYFFKCSDNSCNFFEWNDNKEQGEIRTSNTQKLTTRCDNGSTGKLTTELLNKCYCGLICKPIQSKTQKSNGRHFYSCPNKTNRCKYFLWIDEES